MIKTFAKKLDFEIPSELQEFVIMIIQGESDSSIHASYPVHPNGFPLIIHVYNDIPIVHVNDHKIYPKSRLQIAGQLHEADVMIEMNGMFGQIGFLLAPTALYYLFHKSGDYFLNSWCDFKKAAPVPINKLFNDLSDCEKPFDSIEVIFDFLRLLIHNRLPAIGWIDEALLQIYAQGGQITQKAIIIQAGVSLRHFRRKFKEVVGVSPKYFCKVVQLNEVFEMLNASDDEKLYHLAIDCGYYDQAHFVNDFKKLIGSSPRNFLNGKHSYVKTYMGRAKD